MNKLKAKHPTPFIRVDDQYFIADPFASNREEADERERDYVTDWYEYGEETEDNGDDITTYIHTEDRIATETNLSAAAFMHRSRWMPAGTLRSDHLMRTSPQMESGISLE